jgi:hypothetical protein
MATSITRRQVCPIRGHQLEFVINGAAFFIFVDQFEVPHRTGGQEPYVQIHRASECLRCAHALLALFRMLMRGQLSLRSLW